MEESSTYICDKPSWERLIDKLFEDIKTNILAYFETDHFEFEWIHWEVHKGGVCSRFRHEIWYLLGMKDDCKFPIKTPTLNIIMHVIDHSLCAQLNLISTLMTDDLRNDMNLVKGMYRKCVEESFNRLEPESIPSLLDDLYQEYKILWNAAEKIQIFWRKAISNPNYHLCRKRLHNEYKILQDSIA